MPMTPSARKAANPFDSRFSDLLEQGAFMRFWLTRLAATSASQMLLVAVGWQMYELTSSAWDLGLVGLCQFLPALLLSLLAGHVADRVHRSRIVAACVAAQMMASLILVLATEGHWISRFWLLAISVLLGAVRAFQMPAQQALTPMLVPAHLLARAMAFASAGMQAAIMGGPALGGLIFVAGASAVYGTCTALFAFGIVMILGVHYDHEPAPHEPVTLGSLMAGVHFIWHRKVILGAVSLDLFAVLLGGAVALLPIYASDVLKVGPWGLGLLRGAPAAGALLMSLVLTRWPLSRQVGPKLLMSVTVFGLATVVFGVSHSMVLSLLALGVSGAADMVSVVVRQTLVQLETPDAMRGRVSAVNSVFIGASNQLGEFESGATAALMGPVGSVVAGGVGTMLVAAIWLKAFAALAQRDHMQLPQKSVED